MADVEKVIKEAEDELKWLAPDDKHRRHMGIMMKLGWIYDVLELLKEQQPKEPVYSPQFKHYVCPKCSLVLDEARDDYCPCCGVKIAWDENRYDRV